MDTHDKIRASLKIKIFDQILEQINVEQSRYLFYDGSALINYLL